MTNNEINAILVNVQAQVAGLLAQFPYVEPFVTVQPTEDLQVALDKGGEIHLVAGAIYSGKYILKSNTTLVGNGATINGPSTGPVLDIPTGTSNIYVSDLTLSSAYGSCVVLVGRNDLTQVTLESVPKYITFERVKVPTYRGKRAFDVNGQHVEFLDCEVADLWSPALVDSQAICVLNSPGDILIYGGSYSAGSEVIMVGGDTMKLPGVIPTNITIANTTLYRPLSWRTDLVKRGVKNLLELKTGKNILVQNVTFDGSWKDGQEGFAMVITPKVGGDIHDVVVEGCTFRNVASGFQLLGSEYHLGAPVTPSPLSGVVIRNNSISTSYTMGGRGIIAVVTGAPADFTFNNNQMAFDGSMVLVYDHGVILAPDGLTQVAAGPIGAMTFTNNVTPAGPYFMSLQGNMNLNSLAKAWVGVLNVSGNTISGAASALKVNAPDNVYV